jgi:preprotein translocase subunit SecA
MSLPSRPAAPPRVGGDDAAVHTVRRDEPKVGRNDPCPCGSGKKYKKCHGAAA